MHELLKPTAQDRPRSIEICRRYLRGTARSTGNRWRAWPALLPKAMGAERVALAAFFTLRAELERADDFTARRNRQALEGEINRAQGNTEASAEVGGAKSALGQALAPALVRFTLSAGLLRRALAAGERHRGNHAFETRDELERHAAELATPEARAWLHTLGPSNERMELLADALGTAVLLAHWVARVRPALDEGHLLLPMEELRRFEVSLEEIRTSASSPPSLASLLAHQTDEARLLFAKGWPLCEELGHVRGRALAFFLRWQAAGLSALEARAFNLADKPPPAGILRFLACLGAALRTRRAPF